MSTASTNLENLENEAQRFQLMVSSIQDYAIYMLSPDGYINSWNAGAQRFKGYKAEEILGHHFSRFLTPEDQAAGIPAKALETAAREGRFESEGWRVRKDGTRFWANVVIDAITNEAGQLLGFAKITRDITERKIAQDALRESEQRFRILVQSVTDYAIYMLSPEGIVTSWNAGAERIKGYKTEEILGLHFSNFLTPEDQEAGIPQKALETAAREGRFESEGWRIRKDGSRFWANVVVDAIYDHGKLIGFAKITRDITERKLAQEALSESEERFRLLVQGVTDYAIYMLSPEGIITNWNAGAERIKGYQQDEIVGQHFSRFYAEEDRLQKLPQKALQIAATEGRFEAEGWRIRKDGSRFRAHVIIDAIHNEAGNLIGFAKITRDITEKVKAEEELQRANAALFQSQKLEAIGQLTGGVAHDFNNLLAVLSSGLDVLSLRLTDSKDQKIVDSMKRAVERGASLTQQLLSFARQQPLQTERHNVNHLIGSFEAVLRRAGNSSISFDIQLSPSLNTVEIDATRFETTLLNLVVNARDAMPSGGRIAISTKNIELAADEVANLPAGPYVRVSVTDTGTGMSSEVAAHAFEPFFTTKDIGKGTGLGLSQAYGFIIQSGGGMVLETEPGKGTTIHLYLPALEALDELEGQGDDTRTSPKAVPRKNDVVLIVEDEPDVMEATVELFHSMGYEVLTASSGRDALDVLQRSPQVNIIFSDVMMPNGMSGIDLARAAREMNPHYKIILASGYPLPALKSDHGSIEEFPFMNKPFRLPELAKKLREIS